MQLRLFGQAADNPAEGDNGGRGRGAPRLNETAGAKRKSKRSKAPPALVMEEIADVTNLEEAFNEVAKNKGAPGPDQVSVEEVRQYLKRLIPQLSKALLQGEYRPGEVRRVWIPKPGGGRRGLGIPNVVDRLVQQAVLRIMQPHYDPSFDDSSHGFRPGRSCHTAIAEAEQYVSAGYEWVVDMDLEKFFDRVNHQRLIAELEKKITDRRIIELIRRMLKANTVMPDGVVVKNEEGTPQGGPLSPLLSNIVLAELDAQLRRRGHKFVRYADDCNIYVKSEKAGYRVLESISQFIERRMRLKVNQSKSAVARTGERHFLGFCVGKDDRTGEVGVRLSERSTKRIAQRIVELTPRNWGRSIKDCIEKLNSYLTGWIGFFRICTAGEERKFGNYDAHIRRRLRAIHLKHWKSKRGIATQLIKKGANAKGAWRAIYSGRRSLWRLSHIPVVDRTLNNKYFADLGLVSIQQTWQRYRQPTGVQVSLAFG